MISGVFPAAVATPRFKVFHFGIDGIFYRLAAARVFHAFRFQAAEARTVDSYDIA